VEKQMSNFEEFLELQSEVTELRQKVSDLQTQVEKLDAENRDLKDQLIEKENKVLRYESEAKRHASMLSFIEEEKKNSERVQQRLEKENSALSKRIEEFTVQLGKFATMIEETNSKL
jgi:chromosome segregation ATPase